MPQSLYNRSIICKGRSIRLSVCLLQQRSSKHLRSLNQLITVARYSHALLVCFHPADSFYDPDNRNDSLLFAGCIVTGSNHFLRHEGTNTVVYTYQAVRIVDQSQSVLYRMETGFSSVGNAMRKRKPVFIRIVGAWP